MNKTVFVGSLDSTICDFHLDKCFRPYGPIDNIIMKTYFAFIIFEDVEDARNAITELNGTELMGLRIKVEWAREQRSAELQRSISRKNRYTTQALLIPPRARNRVFVENLPDRMSWQDLKDYMRQAGDVTYANIVKQGEGVVEFATIEDMKNALEKLGDRKIDNQRIRLIEDGSKSRRRSRSNETW